MTEERGQSSEMLGVGISRRRMPKGADDALAATKLTLLIVDDSALMRRLIRSVTCDLAEEVYECGDGREAVAAYARHRPDWVLIDIRMKDVDGLSATREITASYPEARIMIVTADDDEELRGAARRAGAGGYVVKEDLREVRRLLGAPEGES